MEKKFLDSSLRVECYSLGVVRTSLYKVALQMFKIEQTFTVIAGL